MAYKDTVAQLDAHRREIADIRTRMKTLQDQIEPEPVRDYTFQAVQGPVPLSELFGGRRELIVIHNMGIQCPLCTSWADGYNGVYPHLASRAAFAIVGPDAPEVQQTFAAQRGWRFPLLCHAGTSFPEDMGYRSPEGRLLPGLSVFVRREQGIVRISDTGVQPGCDFSIVCRLFELLPDGWGDWRPKMHYDEQ